MQASQITQPPCDVLAAGIRDIIRSARTFAELEHHQAEADLAILALGVAVEPLIERLRECVHLAMVLVLDRRVAETMLLAHATVFRLHASLTLFGSSGRPAVVMMVFMWHFAQVQ